MVNTQRGEAALEAGAERYTLCLTMGALAEIEYALGVRGLPAIGGALQDQSMAAMLAVLGALLRGGGHEISDTDVGAIRVRPGDAFRGIVEAFQLAGLINHAIDADTQPAGPDGSQSKGDSTAGDGAGASAKN